MLSNSAPKMLFAFQFSFRKDTRKGNYADHMPYIQFVFDQ